MKYLWFFGCLTIFIKGLVLTYAALSGLVVGVEVKHVAACVIATTCLGFGCYFLWPWR